MGRGWADGDRQGWLLTLTLRPSVLSHLGRVQLSATPWTLARQAPLSVGFSRQECWSGLPCPAPGDLPHPGIEPASLTSLALAEAFFTTSAPWEAHGPVQGVARVPVEKRQVLNFPF